MEPIIILGIVVGIVGSLYLLINIGVTVYAILTDNKNNGYVKV